MKLKIFSDQSFLPQKARHIPMLYPFWGKNYEDPGCLQTGCFDEYLEQGSSFFEMTSLDHADLAIMPNDWTEQDKYLSIKFAEQAAQTGKQLVIFCGGDVFEEVWLKDAIVFRYELYQSKRKKHEFARPTWSQDLLKKHFGGQIHINQHREKPSIGFCGYAPPLNTAFSRKKLLAISRWFASQTGITKFIPTMTGFAARARALYTLSKSSFVESNFIIRDQFAFNSVGMLQPGGSLESSKKFRQEFLHNIIENDYILCARGAANCSIRFSEALSCGKIPVFINTDCVLPYDFAIDWKKYCVWIEEHEIPQAAEKILEFHNNLSSKDFIELQHECRRIWEKWISPTGYFANLYRHF